MSDTKPFISPCPCCGQAVRAIEKPSQQTTRAFSEARNIGYHLTLGYVPYMEGFRKGIRIAKAEIQQKKNGE